MVFIKYNNFTISILASNIILITINFDANDIYHLYLPDHRTQCVLQ